MRVYDKDLVQLDMMNSGLDVCQQSAHSVSGISIAGKAVCFWRVITCEEDFYINQCSGFGWPSGNYDRLTLVLGME